MQAKDFKLPDQNGKIHELSDYKGKWLLVYFYPKDDTPGCTKEACNFRDGLNEFRKRGVEIVGISKDSVESHKKFSDKYKLNFTLLSDPDHKIIDNFGAWGIKKFMGKEYMGVHRNSYLIDPKGNITKEYLSVNPLTHFNEIISDFDTLQLT
jgi:thioredoxin-dependent peroxiredoxin